MKLSVSDIKQLLDFGCGGRFGAGASMVDLQSEGVAALCNILARHHVAYLADEVGLGKTMQALGVVGYFLHRNPSARVLVISPRENVQVGWNKEFERFRAHVWRSQQHISWKFFSSLREWLRELSSGSAVALLRHPSFSRPVFVNGTTSWSDAVGRLALDHIDTWPQTGPHCANEDERSLKYNKLFARSVNQWMANKNIHFDLVVVDEAQCLRNKDNQTNTVLRTLLKGRVKNWLFLSATPAHSGVHNIATLLNAYPDVENLIDADTLDRDDGYHAFRTQLSHYMIRRPRTYLVGSRVLHKRDYRRDDQSSLALTCQSPLGALSIAVVQKQLVDILEKQDNHFRSGYMASFESLEDSLRNRGGAAVSTAAEAEPADGPQEGSDFYADGQHRKTRETDAPDAGFVSNLSHDFYRRFNFHLPHPKLDEVELQLAEDAFGNRKLNKPGGTKTLVFCRRISSVTVLRQRIMTRYLASIQERCRVYWRQSLDWESGFGAAEADLLDEDAGSFETGAPGTPADEVDDGINKLRAALSEKNWLHRFKATFEDGQRNALFFEQNWFVRLCREGNVDPATACDSIPKRLWAEAHVHAVRAGKRYRRRQFRYLVWHALEHHAAKVFGLSEIQQDFWCRVLRHIYPEEVLGRVTLEPDDSGEYRDDGLLCFESLWSAVENSPCAEELALPGNGTASNHVPVSADDIYWRQVVGNVLGQYLRLTDSLLDLQCAQLRARKSGQGSMLEWFVEWLCSSDIDAVRLRQVWQGWAQHHVLIFSSAVGETEGQTLEQRARQESFDFLYMLDPVVGISGGHGGHKRSIQQFNMPGLPYVMVGTDTIREGVNLHLFCDRVMHYGVAWTPGDLEQRIGRVDRYFSQIERRLKAHENGPQGLPTLDILYPHLRDTLERQQIDTLMQRKQASDSAVDGDFDHDGGKAKDDDVQLEAWVPRHDSKSLRLSNGLFGTAQHLDKGLSSEQSKGTGQQAFTRAQLKNKRT